VKKPSSQTPTKAPHVNPFNPLQTPRTDATDSKVSKGHQKSPNTQLMEDVTMTLQNTSLDLNTSLNPQSNQGSKRK